MGDGTRMRFQVYEVDAVEADLVVVSGRSLEAPIRAGSTFTRINDTPCHLTVNAMEFFGKSLPWLHPGLSAQLHLSVVGSHSLHLGAGDQGAELSGASTIIADVCSIVEPIVWRRGITGESCALTAMEIARELGLAGLLAVDGDSPA